MKDQFGRNIHYMRISITDRCNLRCRYCMPDGIDGVPMEDILTYEEIETLVRMGAKLGIDTLRITGGEPLVRKGVAVLVERLKKIPGICRVNMTTNGVFLAGLADELKKAGLDGVNISLDAADRGLVEQITGRDCYEEVLAGIDAAKKAGLAVKINTVLTLDSNEGQWEPLLLLAAEKGVTIRFIEMMPIGYGREFTGMDNRQLKERLMEKYPQSFEETVPPETEHGAGPAAYIRIPELSVRVGFISAIHGKFCQECNRIRLSSQGFLKPCLCYGRGADLKTPLREGNKEAVFAQMQKMIYEKPGEHCFEHLEQMTEEKEMVRIGG